MQPTLNVTINSTTAVDGSPTVRNGVYDPHGVDIPPKDIYLFGQTTSRSIDVPRDFVCG